MRRWKLMKATRVIITVLLALALLPAVQAEREITTNIDFQGPTEVSVVSVQNWTGDDAAKLREDLDVMFGAADGTLEDEEMQNIERATESDLDNRTTNVTTLNGENGNITTADVTISGAVGPVDSSEPVQIRHDLALTFPGVEENVTTLEFQHTVVEGGDVVLTAPDGYEVQDTQGLANASVSDAGDRVTASADAGEPFTVTLQQAGQDGDGDGAGDNQTGNGTDNGTGNGTGNGAGGDDVPAPGHALIAAAVGLAVAFRALRRPENR